MAPFRSLNVAAGKPLELIDFIRAIERATGMTAQLNMLSVQPGDVVATQSDTRLLTELIGPMHHTQVEDGVGRFVEWYRGHYQK